jgi:hypothetical protein
MDRQCESFSRIFSSATGLDKSFIFIKHFNLLRYSNRNLQQSKSNNYHSEYDEIGPSKDEEMVDLSRYDYCNNQERRDVIKHKPSLFKCVIQLYGCEWQYLQVINQYIRNIQLSRRKKKLNKKTETKRNKQTHLMTKINYR